MNTGQRRYSGLRRKLGGIIFKYNTEEPVGKLIDGELRITDAEKFVEVVK